MDLPAKPTYVTVLENTLGSAPTNESWGGLLGWIQHDDPQLYVELWLLDRATDGLLFRDPSHTLSYTIAIRAKAGDPLAKLICDELNALSPDHCGKTLAADAAAVTTK